MSELYGMAITMIKLQPWTGWHRSRREVSPSLLLQQRVTGLTVYGTANNFEAILHGAMTGYHV